MRPVVIVDYGMGNLWSVLHAFRYLGTEAVITGNPEDVASARTLVLPGVGSFRRGMQTLRRTGLNDAIDEAVRQCGAKILGICLGMQLLGSRGTEDGETPGLALIDKSVDRFSRDELQDAKSPHVGFNAIAPSQRTGLFRGLPESPDFYFVHSYRMLPGGIPGAEATCEYGVSFLAAFEAGNICGTQFHPEKSQTNGLALLRNFVAL